MRSKPSTSKASKDLSKTELTKDAASCKQLEQYSRDFGSSIQGETTQDYNNASDNWKAEIDKHKARRDAKASWHDACMHCRDGGNCRHTGKELMMCETCSNVAHLGCTASLISGTVVRVAAQQWSDLRATFLVLWAAC